MITNLMDYLERSYLTYPDKTAFACEEIAYTFGQLRSKSLSVATYLIKEGITQEPVAVFINRSAKCIPAYFGTLYARNYYVPLDEEMSSARIDTILELVKPRTIIVDKNTKAYFEQRTHEFNLIEFEEVEHYPADQAIVDSVRKTALDTDPAYVVFTSGSTGIPKGVVANHRTVIDYVEQLSDVLRINSETIFGSQTPLYLDACLKELIPTIMHGATTHILPKSLFMFPVNLVKQLNTYKVNTICWVVTGLTMISGFKVLEKHKPEYLHTIAFGSEVFPIRQFNLWKQALPEARFINLYGPTEATGMSTYYEVNRTFEDTEVIPIGNAFKNTEILLINEGKKVTEVGEPGEIYIRGAGVSMGYFRDFERTREVFVQNPLNNDYPELIYKTGDLAKLNTYGELEFVSRKDHQIKHMGYRIELGEIEAAANAVDGVSLSCCIYSQAKNRIFLYFEGQIEQSALSTLLNEKLPKYMHPNKVIKQDKMPLTINGKIDRVHLKNITG